VPEGDTIHRAANRLGQALAGKPLVRFEAARLAGSGPAPGTLIERVEARGKFLLVHFGDGSVLETHMKMAGSWHLYRPGERWRRSPSAARAVLATDDWVAVCFAAPHVVLRGATTVRRGTGLDRLGPDLTTADPDLDVVVDRARRFSTNATPVVDVLLDQRIFSGVGNVFKSEVLHACELHPDTPIGRLSDDLVRRLAEVANAQLVAGVAGGPRTTVPGGVAVYGRAGRPCRSCGTLIEWARRGPHARGTYWCPTCQPEPGRTTPDS